MISRTMPAADLVDVLPEQWSGISRTWFEPDTLADELPILRRGAANAHAPGFVVLGRYAGQDLYSRRLPQAR